MHLHLRRRHARDSDRDQRAQGGGRARGVDRPDPARARRGLQGVRDRVRSLLYDALTGERAAHAPHLRGAARRWRHREARRRAGVLLGRQAVPPRPVHPRRVPGLRDQGPVRRFLRELRQHVRAHRAEESPLRHLREHQPRTAHLAALLRQALQVPGMAARLDAQRRALAAGDPQLRRQVAGGAAPRLGHLPRRAVLRVPDSRRGDEVLLRLAGCADRVPLEHRQVVSGPRPQGGGVLGRGRRLRPRALHRQGHRVPPHALLAGDAARCTLEGARAGPRARHAHGGRREDEQVARHLPQRAGVPGRRARSGVAAVFLRREPRADAERHRPLVQRAEEQGERGAPRQRGEPRQPGAVARLEERGKAHARGVVRCLPAGAHRGAGDQRALQAVRHAHRRPEGAGVLVVGQPASAGAEAVGEAEDGPRGGARGAHAGGERGAILRAMAGAHRAAVCAGSGGAERGGADLGRLQAAGEHRDQRARAARSKSRRGRDQ